VTGIAIPGPVVMPAVVAEFVPGFVLFRVHMFAAMDMHRNAIGRLSPRRRLRACSMLPMRRGRVASGGLA
jgi:hypothetical protein